MKGVVGGTTYFFQCCHKVLVIMDLLNHEICSVLVWPNVASNIKYILTTILSCTIDEGSHNIID